MTPANKRFYEKLDDNIAQSSQDFDIFTIYLKLYAETFVKKFEACLRCIGTQCVCNFYYIVVFKLYI